MAPALVVGQMVRYVIVGTANTMLTLVVLYLCLHLLGWSDLAANLAGYGLGILSSFLANSLWTFRVGARLKNFAKFGLVVSVSWVAQFGALSLFKDGFGWGSDLSALAAAPVYTAVGFLLNKFFALTLPKEKA